MNARLMLAAAALVLGGCAATSEEAERAEGASETEKPEATPSRPAPPAKVAVAPPVAPPPAVAPAPAPQIHRASEVETLLGEFTRLRRLSQSEIAREQDAARQAFNQTRSDPARVRLAMTMTAAGIAAGDDVRALELLDPLVKNVTAPLHGLAFLMTAYIQEMRRLGSQVQGLQQNAQGLQQNVQALEKKLEALRTLERALSERKAAGTRR